MATRDRDPGARPLWIRHTVTASTSRSVLGHISGAALHARRPRIPVSRHRSRRVTPQEGSSESQIPDPRPQKFPTPLTDDASHGPLEH